MSHKSLAPFSDAGGISGSGGVAGPSDVLPAGRRHRRRRSDVHVDAPQPGVVPRSAGPNGLSAARLAARLEPPAFGDQAAPAAGAAAAAADDGGNLFPGKSNPKNSKTTFLPPSGRSPEDGGWTLFVLGLVLSAEGQCYFPLDYRVHYEPPTAFRVRFYDLLTRFTSQL